MGQLKCNYVFHYCCGFLDFELDNFSELYVKNIDFSHEENRYGEALWKSLCEANKFNTINELSTKIYGKLINHIENLAISGHRLNEFTSYYKFIAHFFKCVLLNTDETYENLLRNKLNSIKYCLDSWNPHKVYFYLKDFFLLINSNYINAIELSSDAPIVKEVISFFKDKRHASFLNSISIDIIYNLLVNPKKLKR